MVGFAVHEAEHWELGVWTVIGDMVVGSGPLTDFVVMHESPFGNPPVQEGHIDLVESHLPDPGVQLLRRGIEQDAVSDAAQDQGPIPGIGMVPDEQAREDFCKVAGDLPEVAFKTW